MTDPNSTYKSRFRELTALLGRPPVSGDSGWVEMHDVYKKGWQAAEETVLAPRARENGNGGINVRANSGQTVQPLHGEERHCAGTATGHSGLGMGAIQANETRAAGPHLTGFSREPAPQARAMEASSTREEALCARHGWDCPCSEPLSGPGVIPTGQVAGSVPRAGNGPSRIDERARGAKGGVLAVCVACGATWEREKRRGRPAFKCQECR